MKKKAFRPILILCALFLLGSGKLLAQTKEPTINMIFMRVNESYIKKESRIIISNGDSIIKTIDLDNYVFNSNRRYESNTVVISKTIKEYISEGYELISSTEVGSSIASRASTFIFQKKQITDNTK